MKSRPTKPARRVNAGSAGAAAVRSRQEASPPGASPPRGGGIVIPPALRPGDLVGIVAPGSAVRRQDVEAGAGILRAMGLRVRVGKSVAAREGTFAGSDALRAADLTGLLEDDQVRAIVFARGGWGMSRILDDVPWERLAEHPRILMGYSDLTSLFAPVLDRCGLTCIYGPFASELGDPRRYHRASLLRALFRPGEPLTIRFSPRSVLAPGRAEGPLAGGCLTLLAHLAGTPYEPVLRGRVLALEEVGEPPYRIDRMLTQMRLAGMLEGVRAVLVGALRGCRPRKGSGPAATARSVVASFFAGSGIPVVAGIPFGHADRKISLPLGFRAVVDTRRGEVALEP